MGKITRRGSAAVAVAAATTLAFAPSALAVGEDGEGPTPYRFAGEDRIGTSINAAERGSFDGDTIIVANSAEFADALAAAPLAGALDAPVILDRPAEDGKDGEDRAPSNQPSQQVVKYGERLAADDDNNVDRVLLASGTNVFSDKYMTEIKDAFEGVKVERVAGADRYETAVELGLRAVTEQDIDEKDVNVFLADGTNFPDALAAGPAAAKHRGVVLLTKGAAGIDQTTSDALDDYDEVGSIIAVGGPAAAGAGVGHWSGDPIEVDEAHVGFNRYETATTVANVYFDEANRFVLTSGENFPDAVVGGAYAANIEGPLLLTPKAHLTGITADYLEDSSNEWRKSYTFGGPDSVSENVTVQLSELNWTN